MRVTKWGEFGILCSLYLARKYSEGAVGAAEIAERQLIPLQYTQQILQRLRKGKVIQSVRGPHGGYRLARSPEAITLKDILYAAEGATFEIICETKPVYDEQCSADRQPACGLRNVWYELRESIDALLTARTLASLLGNAETHAPLVPGPRGTASLRGQTPAAREVSVTE